MKNDDLNQSSLNILDNESVKEVLKINKKKKTKKIKIIKKHINKNNKTKEKKNKIINKKIKDQIFVISILILIIIILIFLIYNIKSNIPEKEKIDEEIYLNYEVVEEINDKEFKKIKEFIKINLKDKLINKNEIFKKSDNPKITIIIPVYNGQHHLKTALLSIQNQNLKDIEIIFIDDYSRDKSVYLIKEFMKIDPRIILFQNEENKGALYTKTKGVLNAKGKYVMILGQKSLYAQKDTFITLYEEAEKNNIYILGFGSMIGDIDISNYNLKINRYFETPIIYQPYISRKMYVHNSNNNNIVRNGDNISNYFFKKDFFIQSIKYIKNYLDKKMNFLDEFLLFFVLTRNAYSLKQIKKIFYFILPRKKNNNLKIEEINKKENLRCINYLNYIQFLLENTINSITDKKIASFELDNWFLNNKCRNNSDVKVREEAKNVCKLFLDNDLIEYDYKKKIKIFLNEVTK